MASSSAPVDPVITRIHEDCEIPTDCYLENLSSKYKAWEEDPSILPSGALVVSEPHLQVIRFPLHPSTITFTIFTTCIFSKFHRILSDWLLVFLNFSIIKDLQLMVEDFLYCFFRV